jgi:hypothetical protein
MSKYNSIYMSEQSFTLQRTIPDAWPKLYVAAGTAVKDNSPDPMHSEGLWTLGAEIRDLDMTALELNLYYALGQGICKFAQLLTDEETRNEIVQDGVEILVQRSAEWSGGISAFGGSRVLSQAFAPEVSKAYAALPPEVQLVGNFLSVARSHRAHKQQQNFLHHYTSEDDPTLLRDQINLLIYGTTPHLRAL